MTHNWDSSRRRKDPPGWSATRKAVIDRADGQCQHIPEGETQTQRCYLQGTDVDHIVNVAQGGSEELDNLQLLCTWHHKQKTAKEAAANRVKRTERHPGERHPGLL
jgi:5-methylcytosine-specific restriction protein A